MRRVFGILCVVGALALLGWSTHAVGAQSQPALQVVTVTGTPTGPIVEILDEVNVRLGPGVDYEKVGVLTAGQWAPAVGRTAAGEWIQIEYLGSPDGLAWVYTVLVRVQPPSASLPIVEPPPRPTPRITATIDPTLAAQFIDLAPISTRLPTFTPVDPLALTTPEPIEAVQPTGFPPMLAIIGLLVVGVFGTTISVLRGR